MTGALIKEGASDWQIFQQQNGFAEISLSGQWQHESAEEEASQVHICVKREESMEPVIWWQKCNMHGHFWDITLKVPAGGLYMIETCFTPNAKEWSEWAVRGDIVSHIGVGDLYVIAGQSNSAGYGKDYVYDPCELGVHVLKNNGTWQLASHPLQDSTGAGQRPVNMDGGSTGHSLYLSFAKYLKRELHYPIGLIQTSRGGSFMDQWSPAGGELYVNMMERIQQVGGKVKGIVWYQGCSDADKDHCSAYYEKFLEWKNSLCCDLQEPDLPVFVCQLNRCYKGKTPDSDFSWGTVREAQRRFGHFPNVYTVPTNDSVLSDGWGHISAKSNLVLGERLAKVALTHIYGKSYMCDAPDIVSAALVGDREVLLTFDHVYDKLETFGCEPEKLAFSAEDGNGPAFLESYETREKNRILLRFSRALGEHCKVCGASEMDMQRVVPVDFATHLPILAFSGVNVEKGDRKR
ncbi:MAG: hypothetical protein IJ390_05720 [Lachnospiraceae bacterium]|nr:hypothetical protein [Lachnospiraceae bacterium]